MQRRRRRRLVPPLKPLLFICLLVIRIRRYLASSRKMTAWAFWIMTQLFRSSKVVCASLEHRKYHHPGLHVRLLLPNKMRVFKGAYLCYQKSPNLPG